MQWTGGYAPRFLSFFLALSFFRFDGESQLSHLPLMQTVGRAERLTPIEHIKKSEQHSAVPDTQGVRSPHHDNVEPE